MYEFVIMKPFSSWFCETKNEWLIAKNINYVLLMIHQTGKKKFINASYFGVWFKTHHTPLKYPFFFL